jgi:hypothetical protein
MKAGGGGSGSVGESGPGATATIDATEGWQSG